MLLFPWLERQPIQCNLIFASGRKTECFSCSGLFMSDGKKNKPAKATKTTSLVDDWCSCMGPCMPIYKRLHDKCYVNFSQLLPPHHAGQVKITQQVHSSWLLANSRNKSNIMKATHGKMGGNNQLHWWATSLKPSLKSEEKSLFSKSMFCCLAPHRHASTTGSFALFIRVCLLLSSHMYSLIW